MMFTKSINLVLILVLVILLTPPYNCAQSDTDGRAPADNKITIHDFVFPVETILDLSLACFLLFFFIFKAQCYLDRRNNNVAVAAATAQGLNQSAAALQMFPVLVYSDFQKDHRTAAGTEKRECAICLIEFRGGDKLTLLPCKHVYHPRCVGTWFISKTTCPLCRTDLISAEGDKVKELVGRQKSTGIIKVKDGFKMPEPNEEDRKGMALNCLEAPLYVDIKYFPLVLILSESTPDQCARLDSPVIQLIRFFVVSKVSDEEGMDWFSIIATPNQIFCQPLSRKDISLLGIESSNSRGFIQCCTRSISVPRGLILHQTKKTG
ncbi:hypothetical protein C5167_031796 [Papaver somniferum]|uniref:RING-type E3 ubiquitin transferase n=1 Tax=Papaver somniferum TaxID=3469 RepID=A0A4Y7K6L7_PAPSO|nr:hypothetical protein C5167_031796 [Papaver somniferum]